MGNVTSPIDNGIVCDCGHEESEHMFAAGCQKCSCDKYSQKRLRKRNEKTHDNDTTQLTDRVSNR